MKYFLIPLCIFILFSCYKEKEINQLFNQREVLIGNAPNQVQSVVEKIADIVTHRPLAASYKPEPIIWGDFFKIELSHLHLGKVRDIEVIFFYG